MRIDAAPIRSSASQIGRCGAACLLAVTGAAHAQPPPHKRVALVIGIDECTASPAPLANPVLDARAMAELLETHAFNVADHHDINRDELEGSQLPLGNDTETKTWPY